MDTEWIERLAVAGVVLLATLVAARIADRMIAGAQASARDADGLPGRPQERPRGHRRRGRAERAARDPAVRAVAGSILASSAVIALVVGLAAQTTLSNFVAGILVAFAQPLRLGDTVAVAGASGTVQQIGLTYTVIRAADGARYYVPNTKLASDTIRNATIAGATWLR